MAVKIRSAQRATPFAEPVREMFTQAFRSVTSPEEIGLRRDPDEALEDLSLPSELVDFLGPTLKKLGFIIEPLPINDHYGDGKRTITIIRDHKWQGKYVHLPKWILKNPTPENLRAASFLVHSFERKARLFMLSENLDAVHRTFRKMMGDWKKDKEIQVTFIPWCDVEDLLSLDPKDEQKLVNEIREVFKLETAHLSPEHLGDEDKGRIIGIIAKQAGIAPQGVKLYFRDLVVKTNLPEEWQNEIIGTWTGNVGFDARELVKWAIGKGQIRDKQSYALINLLEILVKEAGPPDDAFLDQIIADYGQITD